MNDFGKLLLRIALGGLMGFHGVHKARNFEETQNHVQGLLEGTPLPEWMFYGVFVTELLAPLLIVLGFWTRLSGFVLAAGMGMAVYLAHMSELTNPEIINPKTGAYLLELQALYFLGGLSLMFMGPGRIAVQPEAPRDSLDD